MKHTDVCQNCGEYVYECRCRAIEARVALDLIAALEAVLLFHSASPWSEAKKTQWWNLTQTNEATTRTLCDTARIALGKLPSCFGDFTGMRPSELPSDLPLNDEQRNALKRMVAREQ